MFGGSFLWLLRVACTYCRAAVALFRCVSVVHVFFVLVVDVLIMYLFFNLGSSPPGWGGGLRVRRERERIEYNTIQ